MPKPISAQNLEQSLTRLSLLEQFINLSKDAIQVSDDEGRLVFINDAASERLGISKEEAHNYFVSDFEKRLKEPEAWRLHLEELKKNDHLIFDGLNVNQKTGADFEAEVTVRYVNIEGAGYVIASSRDVTERKIAEQKLKESEQRLTDVLAIIGEGVWDWSIENGKVWHNKKWSEIMEFGEEVDHHTNQEFASRIYPPDRSVAEGNLTKAIRSSDFFESEFRVVRKDGTLTWIRDQGYVMKRDAQGNPLRILGSISNISQRKRYELELKHQRDILDKLANQLPGMLYQFQLFPDGKMVFPYASRGVKEIYGLTPEQVYKDVNSSLHLLHPEDSENVLSSIQNSAQTLGTWQQEYRVQLPNSEVGWRLGVAKPERLSDGSILWHGYIQDITERKLAEEELRAKNEALEKVNSELDRFVYSTSHDLRAPLTSVLGLVDLCERLEPDNAELQTFFSMMKQAVNRLDNTIKNILDYSRNSRMGIAAEKLPMHEIIHQAIDYIRHMPEAAKIDFQVEVVEKVPLVSDRLRVTAIVNNLITNAAKYQRKDEVNPWVNVRFDAGETGATLTVSDNGEGIPEEKHQRIFEMFVRHSQNSTGSGLGLYMCKEMVERLQGSISLRSIPGKGSAFTVFFPHLP